MQQTISDTGGASTGELLGTWLDRMTDALRDAVLPDEREHATHRAVAPDRDDPGRLGRVVPRLALFAAVALLVSAVALFAFRAAYADKVYPAIAVGDVPVGGMTVDQAVAAVEQRAAELEAGTVSFTYKGQTWTPTLSELGATVDVDASVDAAWALGREDNAVTRLGFAGDLLRGDQQVPLRTTIDRDVLASWFTSVNADIDQRAVDAALVVEGAEVTISPEHSGIVVDEAAATRLILGALDELAPVTAARRWISPSTTRRWPPGCARPSPAASTGRR